MLNRYWHTDLLNSVSMSWQLLWYPSFITHPMWHNCIDILWAAITVHQMFLRHHEIFDLLFFLTSNMFNFFLSIACVINKRSCCNLLQLSPWRQSIPSTLTTYTPTECWVLFYLNLHIHYCAYRILMALQMLLAEQLQTRLIRAD